MGNRPVDAISVEVIRAALNAAGERMRMMAPKVPNSMGAGMKYGRLTAAP